MVSQNMNPNQKPQTPPINEERIKEIIVESLIELGLITQTQKRKQINNV